MSQPEEQDSIVVYPKRWIVIGYVPAALWIALVGLATASAAFDGGESATPAKSIFLLGFGGSMLLLGICGFVLMVSHVLDRRPILSIADEGIRGSGALFGSRMLIAWNEMAAVRCRGSVIVVDLDDPGAVMARSGWVQRMIMRINRGLYGTPVVVSGALASMPCQALAEWIENRRAQMVMK
jgi:hypothetical protein